MQGHQLTASRLLAFLIAASLALMSTAHAALVTYAFTGTVKNGDFIGESIAGTFAYDTATPGSGHYVNPGNFQFTLGPMTGLSASIGAIDIVDEVLSGSDHLTLGGPLPPGGPLFNGFALLMELFDSTRTTFASNALTDTLPPASAFDSTFFQARGFLAGIQFVNSTGTIDTLTRVRDGEEVAVAEPSALGVLLCAAALALWRRRSA